MNNLAEETDNKYPEILVDLRDNLTEMLVEAGFELRPAKDFAFAAAERIRKKWAGIAVYIGKGQAWELSQRDLEIYRRFNGDNRHALCREYDISEQRIYQIVARVRLEEIAKRQLRLWD